MLIDNIVCVFVFFYINYNSVCHHVQNLVGKYMLTCHTIQPGCFHVSVIDCGWKESCCQLRLCGTNWKWSVCLCISSANHYANLEMQESELESESEILQKYSFACNIIKVATVEIWVLGSYLSSGWSASMFTEYKSIIWKIDLKYQQ